MASGSQRAVITAIAGNGILTVLKFAVAVPTHSAAMMNEAVHSLMDTLNQIFLLIGLIQGKGVADNQYAFGHGQKKYLWNLWSAIGLFSIGCGLGLAHAWHAFDRVGESPIETIVNIGGISFDAMWLGGLVLMLAFLIEGYVLGVAWREFKRRAIEENLSPWQKLFRPSDPTLLAVLLEDAVALTGVVFAATGILMSRISGNMIWDVAFSIVIALMLGVTAVILGALNMRLLLAVRDPDAEAVFEMIAKAHREIERYHDLRSIVLDESHTVLVAEVEFREEAILSGLRNRIDQNESDMLASVSEDRKADSNLREYIMDRAAVQATLERSEELIDELESQLKDLCPRVSHVTIEIQGMVNKLDAQISTDFNVKGKK